MSKLTGKPPAKLQPGTPFDRVAVPDAPDPRGPGELSNIGSGNIRYERDKVPTRPWTPDRASVEQSLKGRGLNDCNMLESSREYLNHGPALEGDVDETGSFDGQDLRGIGGRGRD